MIRKACKKCRSIVEGSGNCPNCNSNQFSENWKGRVIVLDEEKSEIAKKLKIKGKGEFAVKVG
ncbi:MAG: DNA-directed RNA polymerase, subunit E'' [Nanoarchaeota archaeon]|nr:DNA-directed RNA polymerase, subunit E'' [Nanoarchaeota archaeon]